MNGPCEKFTRAPKGVSFPPAYCYRCRCSRLAHDSWEQAEREKVEREAAQ